MTSRSINSHLDYEHLPKNNNSVPNSNLEVVTYPEESELAVKNNQITLGPYKDVAGLEHGVFEVQYELVGAVPHVNHLRRDIEISQWGNNLAVEEHYKFENKGAQYVFFFIILPPVPCSVAFY